jgi:DDE domain
VEWRRSTQFLEGLVQLPPLLIIERVYANNRVEADHAQLKRRLRPMRGIKTMTGLRILAAGHAFVQNLRRGLWGAKYAVTACDLCATRSANATDPSVWPAGHIRHDPGSRG